MRVGLITRTLETEGVVVSYKKCRNYAVLRGKNRGGNRESRRQWKGLTCIMGVPGGEEIQVEEILTKNTDQFFQN